MTYTNGNPLMDEIVPDIFPRKLSFYEIVGVVQPADQVARCVAIIKNACTEDEAIELLALSMLRAGYTEAGFENFFATARRVRDACHGG